MRTPRWKENDPERGDEANPQGQSESEPRKLLLMRDNGALYLTEAETDTQAGAISYPESGM